MGLQWSADMSIEHRKYPRAPLSGTVKFFEWNRPHQAAAAEISGNGVFLRTHSALGEGAMVTLRLSIPGLARPFTVLGKVVRTVRGSLLHPSGVGIEFVDIAPTDRRSIIDYVARRTLRVA